MSPHNNSFFSRRSLLAGGLAATAALTGSASAATARRKKTTPRRSPRSKIRVGLQLYSVRRECQRDLAGVIAAVAKMGYEGVEFAGYYNHSAKDLRKMLDDNGLVCCGTHISLDALLGDNLPTTIQFNKTLGNKYLVVSSLPAQYRSSRQAWLNTARLFNKLAEQVKPHAMRVGYHNHSVEFKPIDGQIPWDIFCANTSNDVIMQLDVGNAMHGGADPLPYIYRYPKRAITVHVKEFSKTNNKALIGEGDVNWKAFFALCKAVGGTEWYILEQESYAAPPLECVERCLKNLRKMKLV